MKNQKNKNQLIQNTDPISYLKETRFAAESIYRALNEDVDDLKREEALIDGIVKPYKSMVETGFPAKDAETVCAPYSRRLEEISVERAVILTARETATRILYGALLQIAKQGLSMVYGKPSNWPKAPKVRSQALANVIRHGRNQAMHYESGPSEKSGSYDMVECFEQLDRDFGCQLGRSIHHKNLAKEVIELLGWTTLETYEVGMHELFKIKTSRGREKVFPAS